jgi:hypothetical protein
MTETRTPGIRKEYALRRRLWSSGIFSRAVAPRDEEWTAQPYSPRNPDHETPQCTSEVTGIIVEAAAIMII